MKLHIDAGRNVLEYYISIPFFNPYRHVPPTNPKNDINISPVKGYTFSVCKSIRNAQLITGTGVCSKYVCKYIVKIDKQNYFVVLADGSGKLVTKARFLYNIQVTSSKIGKYKDREKHKKRIKEYV